MLNELVRWNPFEEELSSWHRDIDDLFGRFFGSPELRSTAHDHSAPKPTGVSAGSDHRTCERRF